ncbi:hypothetical protein GR160_12075 [Flavobacterium sp. Sd200]|uniref:hypothetical protein n=1 Tax=Flavobacterium sp. Sd200 TaxID=2692211 RepID=UPI00136B250F|nr:hypothetical protein [Flavobacterium sp. Sd200]MXN91962.1 hypothetical protein [Flavobacterium sp. Sd200]
MSLFKIRSGYFHSVKWGGYIIALSFIRQLLIVPVFFAAIGFNDYAFWLVLSAIVLMIRSLNLGQLHYTSNLINLNYHYKKNIDSELRSGQGANIIWILIQVIIGLAVSFPQVLAFFSNFSVNYLVSSWAQYSFILLLFSRIIFQYTNLYLLRLFEPLGKINLTIKYQFFSDLIDFAALLIGIYISGSIFYSCLIVFVFSLVFLVFIYLFVKRNVPFTVPVFKGINYYESFLIVKASMYLTFSFVIEKIYEVGLNLVVVRTYATQVLPQFTTNRVMSNFLYRVSDVMVKPLFPAIQKEFTLNNERYVLSNMVTFWRVSNAVLIVCITLGMPFFFDLYKFWTGNKLELNMGLICYLFIAIAFQNFSMIFIEFFKKTNLTKQMLTVNIIKVSLTVSGIFLFGFINNVPGLGIAMIMGEVVSLVYVFKVVMNSFKTNYVLKIFIGNLLPVVIFSISLALYIYLQNYALLLMCNFLAILSIYKFKHT